MTDFTVLQSSVICVDLHIIYWQVSIYCRMQMFMVIVIMYKDLAPLTEKSYILNAPEGWFRAQLLAPTQ